MALFYTRKQYIGQLELLAAVAVYYSLPELKGRRVVHWIDNTSAIAALVKGYSGSPDSVRILHAFAAFSLGLDTSSWFLWVPSKANIADLPLRNDFALLEELGSVEVPFLTHILLTELLTELLTSGLVMHYSLSNERLRVSNALLSCTTL
jgi:hypothetical protein